MWYIYTMEYYSAIKKNEVMPFAATWMALEIFIKWSKSDRENKYHMISLIWVIKKMIQMNLFTKQKHTTLNGKANRGYSIYI